MVVPRKVEVRLRGLAERPYTVGSVEERKDLIQVIFYSEQLVDGWCLLLREED